jgi:hypothetical protein
MDDIMISNITAGGKKAVEASGAGDLPANLASFLLALAKPDSWPAAVIVDERYTGGVKRPVSANKAVEIVGYFRARCAQSPLLFRIFTLRPNRLCGYL